MCGSSSSLWRLETVLDLFIDFHQWTITQINSLHQAFVWETDLKHLFGGRETIKTWFRHADTWKAILTNLGSRLYPRAWGLFLLSHTPFSLRNKSKSSHSLCRTISFLFCPCLPVLLLPSDFFLEVLQFHSQMAQWCVLLSVVSSFLRGILLLTALLTHTHI